MHLLIPFAAPLSAAGLQAAATLQLPRLAALLQRWSEVQRDTADERSLTPPHERALAQALGLRGGDGLLPWAAWQAQSDGIDTGSAAWGLLTPAHWHLGTDRVSLLDPDALLLDAAASRALFDAVRSLFTDDGFALHWAAPLRWYASHDALDCLATASLDRVVGRSVDAWLGGARLGEEPALRRPGEAASLRRVRRLQAEVQMLLYTHPVNYERERRGLLPVNSFWLSGCGRAQPLAAAAPQVDVRLRSAALAEDWAAWLEAWAALDAGPLAALLGHARRGAPASLTLCGERAFVRFAPARRSIVQTLRSAWAAPALQPLLESL